MLGTGKQILSSTFTGQIAIGRGLKERLIENDIPDIVVIQEMYSRWFRVECDDLELNELINGLYLLDSMKDECPLVGLS